MSFVRSCFGTHPFLRVRAIIAFMLTWAFLVYFLFVSKLHTQSTTETNDTAKRINQAMRMLEYSKQRNEKLRQMIDEVLSNEIDKQFAQKLIEGLDQTMQNNTDIGDINVGSVTDPLHGMRSYEAPSAEYEFMRRRIQTNIGEMWNYFSSELGKIRDTVTPQFPEMREHINRILQLGAENKRSLSNDMERLREVDGHNAWREMEAKDLSDLVQKRLYSLQNPKDCKAARKLVCKLNKGCGYGCQLHHAVYCFIVAYATERTMILHSNGWRYHKGGWEEVFKPISSTCSNIHIAPEKQASWMKHDAQVVVLPIIDNLSPRPDYIPLAIPEDLSPRLQRLHGDPIVWWVGQFLKYLLRPQEVTRKFLNAGMSKLAWQKPIVGVHIRRTDKVGTEAAFHKVEEYMTHVEDYFLTQELYNGTKFPRRIYLASDDAHVIEETRRKYPQYEVIGDPEIARNAAVSTRYSHTALNGIILDIHLLSLCDYLVCTFSSQVCRVAYEIMQTLYPDAAHRYKSLDDIYYYGGQNAHNREVVIEHESNSHDEIQMKPGDLVGIAGNHWNGFSKGRNLRTNQLGLFPSFKVKDKVKTAKFPTYGQV